MAKNRGVSVKLDKKFFDEAFEPARKQLEKQTGVRIGQLNFTKFLAKRNFKFRLPKQKINIKNKPIRNKGFKLI